MVLARLPSALRSDRAALIAALHAYGVPLDDPRGLASTLTAWTFVHRFGDLRELPAIAGAQPGTFEEAAQRLFPL